MGYVLDFVRYIHSLILDRLLVQRKAGQERKPMSDQMTHPTTVCAWLMEDGSICIHQQPPDGEVGDPCLIIDAGAWPKFAEGLCRLACACEPMEDLPGRFSTIVEP